MDNGETGLDDPSLRESDETDVEAEARRILSLLHEARTELSAAYDIQAVILISRDLAAILASIGRLDQAVSELREGMTATE